MFPKIPFFHFSWTLVMTQRGSDLYRDYSESQRYIEKGLITEEEDAYLKVDLVYNGNDNNNIFPPVGDRRMQ